MSFTYILHFCKHINLEKKSYCLPKIQTKVSSLVLDTCYWWKKYSCLLEGIFGGIGTAVPSPCPVPSLGLPTPLAEPARGTASSALCAEEAADKIQPRPSKHDFFCRMPLLRGRADHGGIPAGTCLSEIPFSSSPAPKLLGLCLPGKKKKRKKKSNIYTHKKKKKI